MRSDSKTKTLFPERQVISSDKGMIVNKAKLIEIIQDIAKEESISKVRESVFDLEKQLKNFKGDKNGLFNISTNGDTLKLNQRYLFNELNQIIEGKLWNEENITLDA